MELATGFSASLPAWLVAELDDLPALTTADERMDLVNRLADRNWREGNGGPFAAIVVDTVSGEVVSVGVNVVLGSGLTSMHAEVMALSLAQAALGRWDLGADGADLELVVNWRPCVMCYGATMWSGVRSLVVAGEGPELEQLTGFDEGPVVADWQAQFEARGIRVRTGVRREEAVAVYRAYGEADTTVYNARGAVTSDTSPTPSVLFVCVHNAGRSQMAAAWLEHVAGDRIDVLSAGSEPAASINPVAVEAMAELGVDIATRVPKTLTTDAVKASDVVITMGCGDTCPIFPGKRYEDWELEDPAGKDLATVRRVRDDIRARVEELVRSLHLPV